MSQIPRPTEAKVRLPQDLVLEKFARALAKQSEAELFLNESWQLMAVAFTFLEEGVSKLDYHSYKTVDTARQLSARIRMLLSDPTLPTTKKPQFSEISLTMAEISSEMNSEMRVFFTHIFLSAESLTHLDNTALRNVGILTMAYVSLLLHELHTQTEARDFMELETRGSKPIHTLEHARKILQKTVLLKLKPTKMGQDPDRKTHKQLAWLRGSLYELGGATSELLQVLASDPQRVWTSDEVSTALGIESNALYLRIFRANRNLREIGVGELIETVTGEQGRGYKISTPTHPILDERSPTRIEEKKLELTEKKKHQERLATALPARITGETRGSGLQKNYAVEIDGTKVFLTEKEFQIFSKLLAVGPVPYNIYELMLVTRYCTKQELESERGTIVYDSFRAVAIRLRSTLKEAGFDNLIVFSGKQNQATITMHLKKHMG